MSNFWNVIWGIIIVLLLVSGLFNFIDWGFNILAIIVVLVIWLASMYNSFVRTVNRVKEAWADIDVQLKRRYDLIPNLVETVKGYAKHEAGTLEKVTEARALALNAQGPEEKAQAENILTGALKSIFAVSESYPELKANENFIELQRELSDTENKIQAARRFYNSTVLALNTNIDLFPNNIIAQMFKFKKEAFFQLDKDEEKEPVKVNFN
jgi:LemA protein